MVREPGKERDTDYEPERLLTRHELARLHKEKRLNDPSVLAVLEARQQERERRKQHGIPVPDREDDLPPSRHRPR